MRLEMLLLLVDGVESLLDAVLLRNLPYLRELLTERMRVIPVLIVVNRRGGLLDC